MKKKTHKYVFVIGGVMSGVGKGIASSSIGKILQSKGFTVNPIKIDPYLNVDAGTMNPTEHGEVFVLDSGLETDQDMGNYERFLEMDLRSQDYMTSGMIYYHIIQKERAMGYKGKCVDPLPHTTEEVIRRWKKAANEHNADISLIEIGGTIGDYQNVMFIEAARILKVQSPRDVMFVVVSYMPVPGTLGEMKTRPTQNAVHQLNSYGVQTDMIIARSPIAMDTKRKEKLAFHCSLLPENIISAPDVESIYDVPVNFEKDQIGDLILKNLGLKTRKTGDVLRDWKKFVAKTKNGNTDVNIAVVGKYFDTGDFVLSDAYVSVIEAVKFSAYWQNARPKLTWINAKEYETGERKVTELEAFDGIIVPGGFGTSGIEGVLKVIKYAREKKIPYLGLCYGMQLMVIEFARNVLGLRGAHTTEVDPDTKYKIIDIMPDQRRKLDEKNYGGSMRLGAYPCRLRAGTLARKAYGKEMVLERHRHRYEVNPEFVDQIFEEGLIFSGTSPDGRLMEIAELRQEGAGAGGTRGQIGGEAAAKHAHPFFMGSQFHPEFLARPLHPHPLFTEFLKAVIKNKKR